MPEQEILHRSHFCRPISPPDPAPAPTRTSLFYKLILPSILQTKRLMIPQKFVKRFGGQLSSVTTLTLPNGGVWPVGLMKSDNKFWFFHGWHEFVQHHSIHVGCFLIFRYEGNSNFNVHIFDLTASEINYAANNLGSSKKNNDRVVDDCDCDETSRSAPRVSNANTISDECVDRQSLGVDCSENLSQAKDSTDGLLRASFRSTRDVGIQFDCHEMRDHQHSSSGDRWSCGLDAANGKGHRTKAKRKRHKPEANESSTQHKDGVELPGLKASKQRYCRAVTMEAKKRAIHAAETFQPSNPFCRIILRQSFVHDKFLLHMPQSFALKYLHVGGSTSITLEGPDGKQWSATCISSGKGRPAVKLSRGWRKFVGDNNLEEGDVCVFEVMNMENVVLKVSIFRALEDVKVDNQSSD